MREKLDAFKLAGNKKQHSSLLNSFPSLSPSLYLSSTFPWLVIWNPRTAAILLPFRTRQQEDTISNLPSGHSFTDF